MSFWIPNSTLESRFQKISKMESKYSSKQKSDVIFEIYAKMNPRKMWVKNVFIPDLPRQARNAQDIGKILYLLKIICFHKYCLLHIFNTTDAIFLDRSVSRAHFHVDFKNDIRFLFRGIFGFHFWYFWNLDSKVEFGIQKLTKQIFDVIFEIYVKNNLEYKFSWKNTFQVFQTR